MRSGATVVDATNLILGRLSSVLAKRLLNGEEIIVLNAEKAVISGSKKSLLQGFKSFLEVGHLGKGPYHYRRPDRIIKKVVRGMLPRKKARGREAYKRLKVYLGSPKEFEGLEVQSLDEAKAEKLRCPYVTLGELAKEIGWIGEG